MKQEIVRKKAQMQAVRPELKVTGISFGGYQSEYAGSKENIGKEKGILISAGIEGHEDNSKMEIRALKNADNFPIYLHPAAIKKMHRQVGIHAMNQRCRQKDIWVNRRYLKKIPKSNQNMGDLKQDGWTPKISGQGKNSEVQQEEENTQRALIEKKRTAFLSAGEQNLRNAKTELDIAWYDEAWKVGAGQRLDREKEEMLRFCRIKEKRKEISGVRPREQDAQRVVAQDEFREEPAVCHVREREKENTGESKKKKYKSDKTKKAMLRDYIIKELIHEEGIDPNSHYHLIGAMLKHDTIKLLSAGGKLFFKMLIRVLAAILPCLLAVAVVMLPFVLILLFILNPVSYFSGIYDAQEEIMQHPLYVKNVLQEMYENFHGEISNFADTDGNNQVYYENGKYSVFNEIMSVYLAQIVNEEDYGKVDEEDDNYPPYLLIDTVKERNLLRKVFDEFNYTEMEDIEVTVKGEDGMDREVSAKKMMVFCLMIGEWRKEYLSGLSENAKKMLDTLLTAAEGAEDSYESGAGNAITGIVIPEGVDEKLVYLAGFLKAEAGNQPYNGKVAVAYVILNRAGGAYGNIKGVLTAPYQFSCYIPYHTVEKYLSEYASMTDIQRAKDSCWIVAEAVYNGIADNPIGEMKYYCNPKACSVGAEEQWRKINERNTKDEIIVIGDHVFCSNCW